MPVNESLQGTMVDPMAALEEELARRGAQIDYSTREARRKAQEAAEAYAAAQATPAPIDPLGELLGRLGGNVASVLGGEPAYRQNAEARQHATTAMIFNQRRANLEMLAESARRAADAAAEMGEQGEEAKHRDRLEKIHRSLDAVNKAEDKRAQGERDRQLHTYAMQEIGARNSGAQGGGAGAASDKQVLIGNFHDRAAAADTQATELENKGRRASALPERLQPDADRQYWGTVREFALAYLRRESGAAITGEEMETARATYFGLPGDSPKRIAQKRAARQRILAGLKAGSGGSAGNGNGAGEAEVEYVRGSDGKWVRK